MNLAFATLLQTTLMVTGATPTTPYQNALTAATENGRPLVVLVGTDWCPGCQTMKHSVIPQVKKDGSLEKVEFVQVNSDQNSELAGQLMRGASIPQLIIYRHSRRGWKRDQMTGAHSVAEVESFLRPIPEPQVAEKAEKSVKTVASRP